MEPTPRAFHEPPSQDVPNSFLGNRDQSSLLCRQNSFISERQSRLSKDTQRVRKNKHHRKPSSNASSVPVPSAQPTHPFTQPWRKCVTVNPERAKKCKE